MMRHPEFPAVSFLCILLLLVSLPSHIRAGSVSTMALIAWLGVMSLIRGVNSLAWAGNFDVKLLVWCDITTKITIGFTFAIPAAALCILRHLESIASTRNAQTTKQDKRRRQKFEALMCFGLPIIAMALHYVVQGHRLDIIEDFGCYPPVYFSVAAVILLWLPPFVMSLVSFVYAVMALRHFLQRRIEFAAHLRSAGSAISTNRYCRLMALAIFEMFWDTGVNAYMIYFNSFTGLRPWISWENVHSNFSRVATFPTLFTPPMFITQSIWQWWIVPISCIAFFIFFAFGEDAMSDYRAAFSILRGWFPRRRCDEPGTNFRVIGSVLPTHRFDTTSLPTISDNASRHSSKAWDDLSLNIPEIKEHSRSDDHMDSYALRASLAVSPPNNVFFQSSMDNPTSMPINFSPSRPPTYARRIDSEPDHMAQPSISSMSPSIFKAQFSTSDMSKVSDEHVISKPQGQEFTASGLFHDTMQLDSATGQQQLHGGVCVIVEQTVV